MFALDLGGLDRLAGLSKEGRLVLARSCSLSISLPRALPHGAARVSSPQRSSDPKVKLSVAAVTNGHTAAKNNRN